MKEILTDPTQTPDMAFLQAALGAKNFAIYSDFIAQFATADLTQEWRFYNDAKSWLCKIWSGKRNLGWLSVWDDGFRVTIFLREIPTEYAPFQLPTTGKIQALRILVDSKSAITTALDLLALKKSQK